MIPQKNNVFGTITAPKGLQPVLRALRNLVVGGRAFIYRSPINGAETLRLRLDRAVLETSPHANGIQLMFNGGVGGSADEVLGFVCTLSEALHAAGIQHCFEICGEDQQLVQVIPSSVGLRSGPVAQTRDRKNSTAELATSQSDIQQRLGFFWRFVSLLIPF